MKAEVIEYYKDLCKLWPVIDDRNFLFRKVAVKFGISVDYVSEIING